MYIHVSLEDKQRFKCGGMISMQFIFPLHILLAEIWSKTIRNAMSLYIKDHDTTYFSYIYRKILKSKEERKKRRKPAKPARDLLA